MDQVNEPLYIILLVGCIVLTAFFTSSETAFFSLQRVRVEQLIISNPKGMGKVARLIQRPDRLLSVILLGTNLAMTAASALATALAVAFWGEQGILIATIALTIIILVFAETTPKTLANIHSERISLAFARPIEILFWIFSPVVFLLSWIATAVTRVVGGTPVPRSLVSQEEIRTMISVGQIDGTMEETEAKMLHKVFEFGARPAREVMVPRTEVFWVEKGIPLSRFMEIFAESPISRFPVYEENTDNVVGVLAVKDVLMAQAKETMRIDDSIDDLIRPIYFTPESKLIDELFNEMRDRNYRMAAVVDEYGGIAGIISLSLLVEEIVGAVGDEFAEAEKEYEAIDENTFQIDGGMNIEEANAEMGLGLPESEDYETVAGFILSHLGRIPRTGERLRYRGLNLTITEMRGMKIEKVLLSRPKLLGEDAAPQG
ncbi:MAG: HlyC/CorC family transporter [Dehalococcoidales bacterium]|nr:MAG: HlyC/CorC family transporter [Dehalococcoidales bacterium]